MSAVGEMYGGHCPCLTVERRSMVASAHVWLWLEVSLVVVYVLLVFHAYVSDRELVALIMLYFKTLSCGPSVFVTSPPVKTWHSSNLWVALVSPFLAFWGSLSFHGIISEPAESEKWIQSHAVRPLKHLLRQLSAFFLSNHATCLLNLCQSTSSSCQKMCVSFFWLCVCVCIFTCGCMWVWFMCMCEYVYMHVTC